MRCDEIRVGPSWKEEEGSFFISKPILSRLRLVYFGAESNFLIGFLKGLPEIYGNNTM